MITAAHRTRAFTLVEIMIVVAIIALLAVIAVPSFLAARERTRETRFANDLRVARDAFDLYASEHNGYPPDEGPGILPPGMQTYFSGKLKWSAPTPLGGSWDWDYQYLGGSGVSVFRPNATPQTMQEVDRMIDDGDLATGAFRKITSDTYTWLLQE